MDERESGELPGRSCAMPGWRRLTPLMILACEFPQVYTKRGQVSSAGELPVCTQMLSVVTVLAKPRPRGWPPAGTRAVSYLTCFACTLLPASPFVRSCTADAGRQPALACASGPGCYCRPNLCAITNLGTAACGS